jgi:hypothetical protein
MECSARGATRAHRRVVLQLIDRELADEALASIRLEAIILAALGHPNVATINHSGPGATPAPGPRDGTCADSAQPACEQQLGT